MALTDPRGSNAGAGNPYTTSYTYDAFDRIMTEETPRGADGRGFVGREFRYDANGNQVRFRDAEEAWYQRTYTAMDEVQTDGTPAVAHGDSPNVAQSEVTRYGYDARENLTLIERPEGHRTATAGDYTTELHYDAADQLIAESKVQVKAGTTTKLTTSYAYDRRGNRVGMSDPLRNRTATTVAQAAGNAAASATQRWAFTYDDADRLRHRIEHPGGLKYTTEYVYDTNGRVEQIIKPRHASAPSADKPRYVVTVRHNARDQVIEHNDGGRVTTYNRRPDGKVRTVRNPRGAIETFTYDPNGDLETRTLPKAGLPHEAAQRPITYTRDPVGNPTRIVDPRGVTTTNTFLASNDLATTARPWMWQFEPNATESTAELVEKPYEKWIERDERTELPDTEGHGDFAAVEAEPLPDVLPDAGAAQFTYDREGRLRSVKDVANRVTQIDRDALGRIGAIKRPFRMTEHEVTDWITTSYGYSWHGLPTHLTDGEGQTTTIDYDQFDRRIQQTAPGAARTIGGPPDLEITDWTYNHNGMLETITHPTRKTTTLVHDSLDRLVSSRDPLGHNTTYAYDAGGNRTCERRPRGNTASSQSCAPGAFTTMRAYNAWDEIVGVQLNPDQGDAVAWNGTRDDESNLVEERRSGARRADGDPIVTHVTKRVFDGRNLPYSQTTFSGETGTGAITQRTTLTEHDPNGNLRRAVNPAGVASDGTATLEDSQQGDLAGVPEEPDRPDHEVLPDPSADATKHATVHVYDHDNLLIERWLPAGDRDAQDRKRYRQVFERDQRGRVQHIDAAYSASDDRTTRVRFGHYETGWISSISDDAWVEPDSTRPNTRHKFEFDYDKQGNQTAWTTSGRESRREHFPNGSLKMRTARKVGDDPEARTYRYAYDANRNVAAMRDVQASRTWLLKRDDADRLTRVNEDWTGGKDTRLAYNPDGDLTDRHTDGVLDTTVDGGYRGGKHTKFTYDSIGRERTMTVRQDGQAAARETTSSWYPSGDLAERTLPNGSKESWLYYTDGRLKTKRRQLAGAGAGSYTKNQEYRYLSLIHISEPTRPY